MPDGSTSSGATHPQPTRYDNWLTVTVSLWLLCWGGILLYLARDYSAFSLLLDVLHNIPAHHLSLRDFFANTYEDLNASILFHLYLAAWGMAALVKLMKIGPRPAVWIEFRQFSRLVLCVTAVAGFPLSTEIALGFDALSPSLVLDIARLVLTPLLLPIMGIVTIGGLAVAGTLLAAVFVFLLVYLPLGVFEYVNNRDIRRTILDQKKQGLALQIFRFHQWLMGASLPDLPDESKGARIATPAEMAALHRPDDPTAMAFGHAGNPLFLKTDKHILIMASTRSGKGVTLIIPHLLRYRGSAFVLDPKGENAKATIRQRTALNDKVHVLDPFGITGLPKARFNPLSRFTPENMEAESKALAAALFVVGERERDHWTASGQQLLAAIILYVYVSPNVPPEKKDLPTVRRQLLGGLKNTLNEMMTINAADGLLSDLAFSFLETPEREFGSIISTAQRQTEILDNPFMIACLSAAGPGEEVDFKAWKTSTMTVYLCLSAPKFPTFNRWLRLVLTSALDEMTDTLEPPALPVCFMLDELATLGHLAAVENAVGLAAGYGIQLVSVFQDVAQMRDLYKGRWASFIGNAGVRALFNLDDYETAEYWSKFIGGRLAETRSTQKDIYGLSKGDNVGEAMRPLLPPDQIMMDFASGKMLVLAQGARPIVTDRVAYFDDKSLAGVWDDPRRVPPAPSPAETPADGNESSEFGEDGSGDPPPPPSAPDAHPAPPPPNPEPGDSGDDPAPSPTPSPAAKAPTDNFVPAPEGFFAAVARNFKEGWEGKKPGVQPSSAPAPQATPPPNPEPGDGGDLGPGVGGDAPAPPPAPSPTPSLAEATADGKPPEAFEDSYQPGERDEAPQAQPPETPPTPDVPQPEQDAQPDPPSPPRKRKPSSVSADGPKKRARLEPNFPPKPPRKS